MKRLLLGLMSLLLMVAGVACSSKEGKKGTASYKIGIITGTTSQGEEEFRTAERMRQLYGDRIVTAVYPDNFLQEQETVIRTLEDMVADPDVKVVVFVQAVQGAKAAIEKAKETREDVLYIAGVPGDDVRDIAGAADIVLSMDHVGVGNTLIQQAKAMGAETFIHISFPRHMTAELGKVRHDLLKKHAEAEGIKFVDVDVPDPMGEGGPSATQKAVQEGVPRWVAEYGKNTAFFGTNCSIQDPLILQSIKTGAIVPLQCCPGPLHGYSGALNIEVPEDKQGDMTYVIAQVRIRILEEGGDGSRFSTWAKPIAIAMIEAGVAYGIQYAEGTITEKNDSEALKACLEAAYGTKVTLGTYQLQDGTELKNFYTILGEYINFAIGEGVACDTGDCE